MTPSATKILATWLEMRGTLWLEPLKMVTSPTPINRNRATSNWLSRCAVRSCVIRLITAGHVIVGFNRRRLLAEQVVIEHLARDGCGGARAEPGVLDQYRDRELRLIGR